MRRSTRLLTATTLIAAAAASASADSVPSDLPIAAKGGLVVYAKIEPVGDLDTFRVFLAKGDILTVTAREISPAYGLFCNLSLLDPTNHDAAPTVKGQNKQRASFVFPAKIEGVHSVTIAGNQDGSGGTMGTYYLTIAVKRAKVPVSKFIDPAGGAFDISVPAQVGSSITVTASTRKMGLDLTSVLRPDGTPEPNFGAAVKPGKKRRSASLSKFPLTGDSGTYHVRGAYDAGASATVKVTVYTNEKKLVRRLAEEPKFDVLLPPFPSVGIGGTFVNVAGINFDNKPIVVNGQIVDYQLPQFSVGGIAVAANTVTHPNGTIYRFPVPGGLAPSAFYDMTAVDADGQGAKLKDAFYVVPPPTITGLSVSTAGPAGGRSVRISGVNLRPNTTVVFDTTFVQPTTSRPTYLDVTAPAHPPGDVTLSIRDEFGQTAAAPGPFTYLNIGSNRIFTVFPPTFLAVGGESVTVRGADFAADTVLTLDGVTQNPTLVSPTVLTFGPTAHADATVKLRVTDQYQQTSAVDVRLKGFTNITSTAVPTPVATANAADGWRGSRVLVGDLDGDGRSDLVLLRPEQAFGGDINRPRIRVLLNNGLGGFNDATGTCVPPIAGDEDWRAKDGVLVDLFGNGRLDLAIITDEQISGGARPSLRILRNTGGGVFADATTNSVPAATTYGDRCQGVAIAAANFDSASGTDLVIVHSASFPDASVPTVYAGTRVLLNNGSGVFTRKAGAMPAFAANAAIQYQGDAVAAGDVTGDGKPDIVVTQLHPPGDPVNIGQYVLAASLLANNGSAVFSDVSATNLPVASDPEYLQGTRLVMADLDGDSDLDVAVASVTRIVSPVSTLLSPAPALRFLANNGSGVFTQMTNVLPVADDQDQLQADGLVIGDITRRGKADVFLVSARTPNLGGRGGRFLVQLASTWAGGSQGLPDYLTNDDLRGADTALVDVDADGALDLVVVRDEANETVRNTLVIRNPLKDFVNVTATSIPAPVAPSAANQADGWNGKHVLVGDINGDGRPDAVLLRPEKASGADANRPRIRILFGNAGGVYTDGTLPNTNVPAVSGDEDWRARDGALADFDGDGDLDLAIVTAELVSGGTKSSLRLLLNNGNGLFTDTTTARIPAVTGYGDHNEGGALGVGRRIVGAGTPSAHVVNDIVILNSNYFIDPAGPTYYAATRVFTNDGVGMFTRKTNALPAVSPTTATQYQGATLAVNDVNNDTNYDILVVQALPPPDASSPGTYQRAARLLVNDGNQVFADVTATNLPAPSDPEYMQGTRAYLVDVTGDARPDIVVCNGARIQSPLTLQFATTPALRIFANDGAGSFSAMTGVLPAVDGNDYLQAVGVAVGDVTGDGRPEIFALDVSAPNNGGLGGRLLVNVGGSWVAAPKMLPVPSAVTDDLRGVDAAFADVDADGDLDLFVIRDEFGETGKRTLLLKNLRK